MTLFQFLAILKEEGFPFNLSYVNYGNYIKVTVDTFSKVEEYTFDENGLVSQTTLVEVETTEEHNVILNKIDALQKRPECTWIEAAKDLKIIFINPYKFIGLDGLEYEVTGLLPQFGYGKGVLITSRKDNDEASFMADLTNDYMTTGLSPRYYDSYDRLHIIETLSEWGWIGGPDKPEWLIEEEQ